MSEVRPWIGSPISVGQFKIVRNLTVMDCSVNNDSNKFYFEEPSPQEKELSVWSHLDRAFAKPAVRSDDGAEYVPTQIITELFKNKGIDGIAYKSAFGENGYNVVLFDIEAATLINCRLYEAETISINFRETANPYFIKKKNDS